MKMCLTTIKYFGKTTSFRSLIIHYHPEPASATDTLSSADQPRTEESQAVHFQQKCVQQRLKHNKDLHLFHFQESPGQEII